MQKAICAFFFLLFQCPVAKGQTDIFHAHKSDCGQFVVDNERKNNLGEGLFFPTSKTHLPNEVKRANQIIKILLPDEKLVVSETGIRESETFSLVTEFALNRQLKSPIITIDEKALTFNLCCMSAIIENLDGTITEHFASATYPLTTGQLPLAKELKTLLERISITAGE